MAIPKQTGKGETEIRTNPPSLMLFNFDIDGDQLKDAHKAFLIKEALPTLRAGGGVAVVGLTDTSGSDQHNQDLSERRAAKTVDFLREQVPTGWELRESKGFGERAAQREIPNGQYDPRFRTVLVFLNPPTPPITQTKHVEVSAKSYIALIGSRTGSIPGMTTVPIPIPPTMTPVPTPVTRQFLLETLAKATDSQFNENPLTTSKDKHYRLFSSCRFTLVIENKKLLAAVPSTLDTDVGMEGPLQPPDLITTPVSVSPKGGSFVTFSWFGKGRPHLAAEPAFQKVQLRSCSFIWHSVEGRIDVSTGVPVTTVKITGSQFPSHRVFIDGKPQFPHVPQGVFSNLWVPDPSDRTKVR